MNNSHTCQICTQLSASTMDANSSRAIWCSWASFDSAQSAVLLTSSSPFSKKPSFGSLLSWASLFSLADSASSEFRLLVAFCLTSFLASFWTICLILFDASCGLACEAFLLRNWWAKWSIKLSQRPSTYSILTESSEVTCKQQDWRIPGDINGIGIVE